MTACLGQLKAHKALDAPYLHLISVCTSLSVVHSRVQQQGLRRITEEVKRAQEVVKKVSSKPSRAQRDMHSSGVGAEPR